MCKITYCLQTAAHQHTEPISSDANCRTFALTAEPAADSADTLLWPVCTHFSLYCCNTITCSSLARHWVC